MILHSLEIDRAEFERRSGWEFKPEGICKGDVCFPISASLGDKFDVKSVADILHMPLIHDRTNDLWSLGPQSGGRALASTHAPELTLPDWNGNEFVLSSLGGKKVLLVAWASW